MPTITVLRQINSPFNCITIQIWSAHGEAKKQKQTFATLFYHLQSFIRIVNHPWSRTDRIPSFCMWLFIFVLCWCTLIPCLFHCIITGFVNDLCTFFHVYWVCRQVQKTSFSFSTRTFAYGDTVYCETQIDDNNWLCLNWQSLCIVRWLNG